MENLMQDLKIEYLNVNDLKPYENNARKHEQEDIQTIVNSIKEFGFNDPIGVWGPNNLVVEGHGRLLACKQLGMDKVQCIRLDHLTDEQRRAYTLAHNKTAEMSAWDFDLLDIELDDIEEIDMEQFGFEFPEEEEETEIIEDEYEEDDIPKRVKKGQIWKLGNHRLMCGDSTSEYDINKLLNNNNKIDMIYTDPPYGMKAVSKSGVLSKNYKNDILGDEDNKVAINSFNLCKKKFKDSKKVWWGANYYTECLPSSECWIVWDKNNGASDQTDCELAWTNFRSVVRQFTMASEKQNRVHPTQKPTKLFKQLLDKFDKENSFKNILDLFGGSGSTLIACEQLKKNCYMMELDEHYADVIINRWENFTGEKAELIEDVKQ